MSSGEATAEAQFPTDLQIFVLAYLTSEETKRTEKEPHPLIPHSPLSISIIDLIKLLPSSYIPEKPTVEEVRNQLKALEKRTLLTSRVQALIILKFNLIRSLEMECCILSDFLLSFPVI
ncbi:MAG: hypothetical protein M3270_04305 [Thermoproteota archaeon]|nr:hypothetical protein [Thermoproteota archaeon]